MKRFWEKVQVTKTCWLWTASKTAFGYGKFGIGSRIHRAHRVVWEIENGDIPDGMLVLHRCDVPACVRPDHLFLGTPSDNTRDMMVKGRHRGGLKGETNTQAKLSTEQVREIRRLYESTLQFKERDPRRITMKMLAAQFGVSHTAIVAVITRQRWVDV